MTIDQLIRRYKIELEELNIKRLIKRTQRMDILEESAVQSGERVQTSGVSDPTCAKAARLIEKDEIIDRRIAFLELRCGAVACALNALTDREREVIECVYFKDMTYLQIDVKNGMPTGTSKRVKKEALGKMEYLLTDILMMNHY